MTTRQRDAIEAPLGPVLVVAGPGAGKTYCLIGRVTHLLRQQTFPPHRICAVTFTNRAAEEITARLRASIGIAAEDITRGTLHALCLDILREHGEITGLKRGFGVADEEYQRVVLRRLGVPRRRQGPVLTRFGRHRLQHYPLTRDEERLFLRYGAWLESQNLIDFDEIISRTAACFDRFPAVAETVRARWDYLLVDEFQDLNAAQYAILRRLAEPHHNLFVVGDDEQSIFSWTGADPEILSRFQKDYAVEPVILDENRRCSRQIFETARRLLGENPSLFDKRLRAERFSEHEVAVQRFASEQDEADWLVGDLLADRERFGLDWGHYSILYRRHGTGHQLEGILLAAGIPCRLARGRSLRDDLVVGYVVASLRIMASPGDPVAIEAAAELLLPDEMREETRTIASRRNLDFAAALREFARSQGRGSPEGKKAWRFIYYLENLAALYRSQKTLRGLVEELLSQRVSRYGNRLEEHYEELSDPAETPEVVNLAERLIEADRSTGGRQGTWIQPMAGLDLALRRMLVAAGFKLARDEASARLVLGPGDGGSSGLPLRLFKALQLLHSREFAEGVREFVAFDLETTDRDVTSCEIVEVGAVKVVDGKVVDRFHALVRPDKAVSALATEVHGYTGAALQGSPRFADVWQKFRDFAGDHLLVAHNGLTFDVPVLLRMAAGFDGVSGLVFFDTLPLARSLFRGSRRLQDLAERFGIPAGRSHHAQDDAETLAAVFGRLARQKTVRARKSSLANLLDWLGLAMGLEAPRKGAEAELLTTISAAYTLGRYSDCLELYAADRLKDQREDAPAPDDVIREIELRSGLKRKNLQADKKAADRYPEALARLERLLVASEAPTLDDSVRRFLEQVTLSISDGVDADHHRVNLLTLHATKGLEFSRVYVVGVEDAVIPGLRELEENRVSDIQEARRLLYVGMTRAMDRLILTHCDRRGGDTTGGTRFLNEMGLTDGTITVGRADGQAVVSELVPILQPSSRPGV